MSVGIQSQLDEIKNLLSTQHKASKKPWKLPFTGSVKFKIKKLAKNNQAIALMLRHNMSAYPAIGQLGEGTVKVTRHDGTEAFYEGTPMQVFQYLGKYPLMVIPEWSLRPIGGQEYTAAAQAGLLADPQQIVINALMVKEPELDTKKKMKLNPWLIIGGIILLAVVAYIFLGGGKIV